MADNLDVTPGTGTKKVRSHETGVVNTQINKLATGETNADEQIIPIAPTTVAKSVPVTLPTDHENAATPQTIAELASVSILSTYVSIGTFTAGTRIAKLVNTTSVVLVFSLDGGTHSHVRVFPMSKEILDFGANRMKTAAAVFVKYDTVSPGSGNGVAAIEGLSA